MRARPTLLGRSERGAIAPTVALSLFALVAVGGLAFDYSRMAGLDTELQDAADHAALAAASQLDGADGACARAANAAANFIANSTFLSNDGGSTLIAVSEEADCDSTGRIRFWQDEARATAASSDANAKFVEVEVEPREADYVLTPLSGAFSSGNLVAVAFAGMREAVCKTPPVMMCNPAEADSDPATPDLFDPAYYTGRGVRLMANGGSSVTMGPGLFGFLGAGLDTSGTSGTNTLRRLLGYDSPPGECQPDTGVDPASGARETLAAAFNTRFDIYDSSMGGGQVNCDANSSASPCSSSANAVKDLVMKTNASGALACGTASGGANGWTLATNRYLPTSTSGTYAGAIDNMGLPRDKCHAISQTGSCTFNSTSPHIIGDGAWDIAAYFRVNHNSVWNGSGTMPAATLAEIRAAYPLTWPDIDGDGVPDEPATPTRYQVYRWEMGTAASHPNRIADRVTPAGRKVYGRPVCQPPGAWPDAGTGRTDRRIITVAVINCLTAGAGGGRVTPSSTDVAVQNWIDVFLVEPSFARDRTNVGDIYIEVVGASSAGGTGSTVQLVKKSVPYLIE